MTPRFEESEHFFFRLSAFEDMLKSWIRQKKHWRQNVLNFTLGFLEGGLNDRAITRDIGWGISVPQPGFEHKRIYVWFEAVIGYLSASKEWAKLQGRPDDWQLFWNENAKGYYFIGKDNIPFHTLIWPAMLMGYGDLVLPEDVPANEFLTIESKKISTSRNWAVWLPDFLSRYDADQLRYVLSVTMPETGDTDFSWHEFVRRNNDELVATYGNLVHRVLTFTQRNFNGIVPEGGEQEVQSRELIAKAREALNKIDENLARCHFKEGVRIAMGLSQEANRFLDDQAPWKSIKTDPQSSASTINTVLFVLSALKTALYPFLPFSSTKLHTYLGLPSDIESSGWSLVPPATGTSLPPPTPLFNKLDESIIEEEMSRLGKQE
jgi:methionyl-tRNA synthetase